MFLYYYLIIELLYLSYFVIPECTSTTQKSESWMQVASLPWVSTFVFISSCSFFLSYYSSLLKKRWLIWQTLLLYYAISFQMKSSRDLREEVKIRYREISPRIWTIQIAHGWRNWLIRAKEGVADSCCLRDNVRTWRKKPSIQRIAQRVDNCDYFSARNVRFCRNVTLQKRVETWNAERREAER